MTRDQKIMFRGTACLFVCAVVVVFGLAPPGADVFFVLAGGLIAGGLFVFDCHRDVRERLRDLESNTHRIIDVDAIRDVTAPEPHRTAPNVSRRLLRKSAK